MKSTLVSIGNYSLGLEGAKPCRHPTDALFDIPAKNLDSDSDSDPSAPAPIRTFGFSTNTEDRPLKRIKLDKEETYGLEDDCPAFVGMSDYVQEIAGASLTAARELRDGRADVAIAWTGGRHHSKRSTANGFCYINDVVLAILELKLPSLSTPTSSRIKRVLYLDIDLHHGDGVSLAFRSTPSVLTLSLHLFAPLFFPSTGALDSTGPPPPSSAAHHDLNLAAHEGLSSKTLLRLFNSCILPVLDTYHPEALVMQLGCDGLNEDPCGEFNISLGGMGECVRLINEWRKRDGRRRLLMLGGGGYHNANAARCWAYLSSIVVRSLRKILPMVIFSSEVRLFAMVWYRILNRYTIRSLTIPSHYPLPFQPPWIPTPFSHHLLSSTWQPVIELTKTPRRRFKS